MRMHVWQMNNTVSEMLVKSAHHRRTAAYIRETNCKGFELTGNKHNSTQWNEKQADIWLDRAAYAYAFDQWCVSQYALPERTETHDELSQFLQ